MIILPDQKTLIVTPPHTGSGHLSKLFPNLVYGPNPDGNIDHHYGAIHNAHLDWRKILIVRRPYERLIGLYQHCRGVLNLPDEYWDQFCMNVFMGHHNFFYGWTISRLMKFYIKDFNPKDFEIWPAEKFPELPPGIEGTMEPGWSNYDYSKYGNEKLINIWAKDDLAFYE